jgi:hypothetical protein
MSDISKSDIKEFVEAAHGDIAKLKQMLAAKPELLNMANGNETALGAACQMRRVDIIEFLLEQGAPLTISAACVLGQTAKVEEFLAREPSLLSKGDKQSHMKHPIYFAEKQPETLAMLKSKGAK